MSEVIELDRDGVAGPDRPGLHARSLRRDRYCPLPIHHVVELRHFPMEMRTCGSIRRKRQVIDVSPGPNKYRGVERAPVLHRALSAAHGVYRAQQRSIEPHCHEDRNGVEFMNINVTAVKGKYDAFNLNNAGVQSRK